MMQYIYVHSKADDTASNNIAVHHHHHVILQKGGTKWCMYLLLSHLMGQYCFTRWHLSLSVTLPEGAQAVGQPTLRGGPVVLHPVRASPCFI